MPLLPIDLQTMFNQMGHIGRETAVQREVPTQYQVLQGAEIARKTVQDDSSVNETRELGDGLERVKEERQRQRRRQGKEEASGSEHQQTPAHDEELFDDPDLGHNVDLVG